MAPNGKWIAYVSSGADEVRLIPPSGGEFLQTTIDDEGLYGVKFSPNSKYVGVTSGDRLYVNEINTGETIKTPKGAVQGWSFAPDSKRLVYAKAKAGAEYPAASDLYVFDLSTHRSTRISTDRTSLNPLWTKQGIVYDQVVGGKFELRLRNDTGGDIQVLVDTPPATDDLTFGLSPVAASSDGRRILASLEGQSRSTPFAVEGGAARSLGENNGFVPTGLARDGSAVLGFTGLGDPGNPHDVLSLPWGGGAPTKLVANALWGRWNR